MISILLRGDYLGAFVYLLSTIFVIFLILPAHEFAHAFTAYKCGDYTARNQGRVTLNPFAHVDWFGAAMILLVGFGWAKPVPVNAAYLRNPKRDMALVSLAGPLANLILGFASMFLYNAVLAIAYAAQVQFLVYVCLFFQYVAIINIGLAIFNLIPIPPLDGSKILAAFLPDRLYYKFFQYERYLYIALIVLLLSGALTIPLGYIREAIFDAFNFITRLPFGALLR